MANVHSYVVTQRRTSDAGDVADSNIDLAAIFGAYGAHTVSETKFRDNMERIFYTFVRSGALPPPDRYVSAVQMASGNLSRFAPNVVAYSSRKCLTLDLMYFATQINSVFIFFPNLCRIIELISFAET